MKTINWTCRNGEDCESPVCKPQRLPASNEICGECRGEGKSSAHLGWFTGDQLREDPDFAEEYMDGAYDRVCDKCGGRGIVAEIDWELVEVRNPALVNHVNEVGAEWAEYEAERAYERRMGC